MKGRIFLFLFGVPFFAIGAWMAYLIGSDLVSASAMQRWTPVSATLSNAGYTSHTGDDSTTYEAFASYHYGIAGTRYNGQRVGLADGADNIGDYQEETGNLLRAAWNAGQPVTVYVDPENPRESIIDRDVRWGLIGFRSIFVLLFGGLGLGAMVWALRAPKKKDQSDVRFRDQPWLINDDWQTATIRSNSKTAMYGAWFFAIFWNLVSAPLPFVLYGEVLDKQNYIALVGLLFPAIGLFLLSWAYKRTREWRRFGPTPVTLDPFPGSIGGHVGGTVDLRLAYRDAQQFEFTLTNLESYVSGSGKNRSRRERAKWQDAQVAHAEPSGLGTRLTFRFEVPAGLRESVADPDSDTYYLWRLNVHASLDGVDFDRDFEIPVYATAQQSQTLKRHAVQKAQADRSQLDEQRAKERMHLQHGIGDRHLHFPMGRNLGGSAAALLVGAAFLATGWYIAVSEGKQLFGTLFGGFGALAALMGLYATLNSLDVRRSVGNLVSVRRVLGVAVRRKAIPLNAIERFSTDSSLQTQSGGKHRMFYSIYAHGMNSEKLCVGEGFRGQSEAKAAIRILCREFSITPHSLAAAAIDERNFDALASD